MQSDYQLRSSSGICSATGYAARPPALHPRRRESFILLLVVGALGLGSGAGMARATPFNPPSLDGYSLYNEHDVDGDGDGVKETHVQQYYNAAGDSIYSMTTNGHVWAWSLDTKGEPISGPKNYVIRDSDCDGVFDEVYGLDEKYYLPQCVMK